MAAGWQGNPSGERTFLAEDSIMPLPASETVLDREYLPIRAKLLEVAAAMDRIDRAGGASHEDRRVELIRQSIAALLRPDDDRAEQIQLICSRPYDDEWREKLLDGSR